MIICQASKGPSAQGYWRWRIVDGKTCHYVGHARVDKSQLAWAKAIPAKSAIVHYTDADLGIVRKSDPIVHDWDELNPLDQQLLDSEQTPQQRIDGAFDALGLSLRPVLLDQVTHTGMDTVAVAVVAEEATATPPMLRNALEIPLMLGVIFVGYLVWRGIAATFGTLGRAE